MAAITLASASPTRRTDRKAGHGDRAAAPAAEHRLLLRYHRWGDLGARDELVERFLPLARTPELRDAYMARPPATAPSPAPGPSRRPRRARRPTPAARTHSRAALHVYGRAARRSRAGREPGPGQGDRPLRPRSRREVHELRDADHRGRAEAP